MKKPHHLDEFESGFDDEMELSGLPRRSVLDRKRRQPPALEPRYVALAQPWPRPPTADLAVFPPQLLPLVCDIMIV